MFAPFGKIYSLDVYRGLLGVKKCLGAKHSSLRRELEWQRLALRDAVRPDFRVYTGNDLAIDMVMYGSDYLLGLSTFAPDLFAKRDRLLGGRRPGVLRTERRAAVPRLPRVPRPGAGVQALGRDVPEAPRLDRLRRDPPPEPRPPRYRPRDPVQHCRATGPPGFGLARIIHRRVTEITEKTNAVEELHGKVAGPKTE